MKSLDCTDMPRRIRLQLPTAALSINTRYSKIIALIIHLLTETWKTEGPAEKVPKLPVNGLVTPPTPHEFNIL